MIKSVFLYGKQSLMVLPVVNVDCASKQPPLKDARDGRKDNVRHVLIAVLAKYCAKQEQQQSMHDIYRRRHLVTLPVHVRKHQ
tara:strand:- start:2375 stop:2623 length:249 start_codon:yes stop_codon:yes gene_type:complete